MAVPRFAVLRFPGSNCDQDAYYVIRDVIGAEVEYVWHQDSSLAGFDVVIVPGGFSYGDYLRCGAVARFAPAMEALQQHVEQGKLALGICNGFQILCEAHLLPGALIRNQGCKFICKHVDLRVENNQTPFTSSYTEGQILSIPIAHGEGCYVADETTLSMLEQNNQILFRYATSVREQVTTGNPNGSMNDIAGICNARGNVMGMMPHPERASESILGSVDGKGVFSSMVQSMMDLAL